MRSVGVRAFGGEGAIEVLDVAMPEPGEGEVRVRIGFSGVNPIDIAMRSGAFAQSASHKTPLPLVLGMEAAGEVDKVGPGVSDIKVGDRVAYCLVRGSYAEAAVVPAGRLVPVPDGIPLDVAAALQIQGCTAHYLVTDAFPVQKGDTCVVLGGAGGVAQLLIQLCREQGAVVVATASSADKAAIARARGADHVLQPSEDLARRVLEITSGLGANVVYDGIGKDTMASAMRALRRRGLYVAYGTAAGVPGPVAPQDLGEMGSIFLTRPHLADYMQTPAEIRRRAEDLFGLYRAGRLTVSIDRVLPLASAAQAHNLLATRAVRGKLLLKIA